MEHQDNLYETNLLVSQYLLFHYGKPEDILPYPGGPHEALDFAVRSVHEMLRPDWLPPVARALDVGCAVGRSSFELARYCHEVTAIDYSHAFISRAREIQESGTLTIEIPDHGDLTKSVQVSRPMDIDPSRVTFQTGDAHQLHGIAADYDVVFAANLIDRLHTPLAFLRQLPDLLTRGGQLILTSPYTWLEDFTPRENWLGGRRLEGSNISTLDALQSALSCHFNLIEARNIPFLIREHARKYQWSVAQASLWRKI